MRWARSSMVPSSALSLPRTRRGGVAALLHERRQAYRLDRRPAYIQARDDAEDSVSARRVMGVSHQDVRRALIDALPGLAAVAVLVWWSTDQGGYFQKTFYPGTVLLLGVLVGDGDRRAGELPRAAAVGAGGARRARRVHGMELPEHHAGPTRPVRPGTPRTARCCTSMLFALFSRAVGGPARPRARASARGRSRSSCLAVVVLLKLPEVLNADGTMFAPGLEQPLGYSNANAALLLMALWPALDARGVPSASRRGCAACSRRASSCSRRPRC